MVEANIEMLEDEPSFKEFAIEEFLVRSEPYYRAVGDELELFEAAYEQHIPVLLKGPHRLRQDSLRGVHGLETRPTHHLGPERGAGHGRRRGSCPTGNHCLP